MTKGLKNWNEFPWKDMNRVLSEMNEMFGEYSPLNYALQGMRSNQEFPLVNMWSNEDQVVLTAELPGIQPEEIGINVLEDTIFIQGERKNPVVEQDKEKKITYHRQERASGKFKRGFQLPFRVETDKVTAKYENGILKIALPRSEKEKPKQIKVSIS
ncbi:MAG: Hsp20/alpha crystallin family protein [Candidatus Brocadiae bacterium]|nr:Hsp20/alpha crystallin family protein [Candidatus Brocadiia bacterium]